MILLQMKTVILLKNLEFGKKKTFGKTYMGIVRTTFIFDEKGVCTRVIEK
jgi:peroxiredoxin